MSGHVCRSLTDVIEFAIDREERARDFYLECGNRAKNPGVRVFFEEMAAEEASHMERLMNIDVAAEPAIAWSETQDLGLLDYLVDVRFSPDMTYQEALIMAMKKEEKAHAFYEAWKDRCGGGTTAKVFGFLAEEELKHKHKLEENYDSEILQWD